MKAESEEVLSLLADGEQVDPDRLAAALAEPGAAETLVEYARVHRAVNASDARPSDGFYEAMRGRLGARTRHVTPWRTVLAAAALVVLSVVGGMWTGWSMLPARTVTVPVAVRMPGAAPRVEPGVKIVPADCVAPGPPKPDRIVEFVPAAKPQPAVSGGGNKP